nr:hypothetical protein [Tanacetum cinerariifolium]
MIPEPGDPNREVLVNETFHVQTDDELTEKELKQIEANDQAIKTILLCLPEDIYAAVDSCETDQKIWLRVQQMMKGTDIGIQKKKVKLFNEWERFTSTDGESIESYYHRFLKLMNDLKRNKHFPEKIASNLKFLNNLHPEWSRHVTIVHQTKDLHIADYTKLYDFLKYNQKENYMQQPMPNPEDITDPTTAMNMALALMAKALKLNYSTPTNNNQMISSNPRNRQICSTGYEHESRQTDADGWRNQVIQNTVQSNPNGNGNLVAARAEGIQLQAEEFDLMADAVDLDEIEEVNANCILMANLQQASTSGTQTDKALVYDSDGLAEVHNYKNCYDNEIFNMFTQEEQYTKLLEPIPEPHQVPQNDNNVISEVSSVEQSGRTVEQHLANFEKTRTLYDSLYNNLAIEVEKVNTVNRKLKETNAELTTELARFKNQEKCFEISQEKYDKLERCYQKSVYQEQCLSKKDKHSSLKFRSREELYFLNTSKMANVSKPISIPNEEFLDDTTPSVARKFLNEVKSTIVTLQRVVKQRMTLETHNWSSSAHQELHKIVKDEIFPIVSQIDARVQNFEIQFLKEAATFVGDFKSLAKEIDESLAKHKALELEIERLLRAVVSQDIMSVDETSNLQTELEQNKNVELEFQVLNYAKENAHLKTTYKNLFDSITVTQNQTKTIIDSLQKKLHNTVYENAKLRAQLFNKVFDQKDTARGTSANTKFAKQSILGKPPKPSMEEKHVRNKVRASIRIKPIIVSQPPVITKKVVNSDSIGLSSTGVDNTKIRRPQSRSNTKNDRNVKSKVVCAMCKQCLISVNHYVCLLNYVNGMTSRGKKQKANVLINEKQKNQQSKVKKTKKVGSIKRLASPKPSKPRSFLRWSPTGRIFDLKGKIIASSESESQSDCSKGDNACTSNPLEPTIKRFPNSTFSLAEVAFRRNACFFRNLEGVDLLPGNRTTNLYTINLHEMASASPICLMARASSTKSWLWHQRLSHLNFDAINDLAKNDLVSGLSKFKYHKEHLCPSCEQGKIKRASHPPKPVPNSRQRLHFLHMDLCGPMRIASINGKRYVLAVVDDYSRYTWSPVIIIRTDNGTKFKNQVLKEYFDSVGISHQVSSVRTPQQNGVVKQRNQTLVEAARTMLTFSRAPLFLWAEAIATACFTQNRSIIYRRFNKTPYEIINGRKSDISFLHVFGALCYPKNDREDIKKLGAKGDIGFFIGYSADSCAYRVFNRRIKKIMETMNVSFDELSAMAFEQRSSKPELQSMTSGELDLLFEAMYDDYIGGQPSTASRTVSGAQAHQVRQTLTTSTSIADTAPTPTNSSSQATIFPNTSQDVDELNSQQQHAQQQGNQAPI